MSDDDWGVADDAVQKEVEQPAEPSTPNPTSELKQEETKQDKKEDAPNADLDVSQSWIVDKPNVEPDKKVEERGRRGGRGQEKIVTVQEKAEELKPDKNDESVWGEEPKEKEKQEAVNERGGRGRGNREGQQENGDRGGRGYNRNYQGNEFGGRGNKEEDNTQRGRGNRDGQRGNRNQGGLRGNRNGDEERVGGDRGNRDRGQGDRGYRGDRDDNRGRPWQNRGDRDGERGRGRGRGRGGFYNDRNYHNNQGEEQTKTEQKNVAVKATPAPKGRKSWPESSIHIFQAKLSITYRRIHEFKCKLLIVPFKTPKLEYYPGSIINQSKINYKEKLTKKDLKEPGKVYCQKAQDISSFEAVAFLKIDETQIQQSLKTGVKEVFMVIASIAQVTFDSMVFCVSQELGSPLPVIHQAIKSLEENDKVKEFYINTASSKCFLDCLGSFRDEMQVLIEENEISIE